MPVSGSVTLASTTQLVSEQLLQAAATRNLSVLEAAAAVIQRLPKAAGTGIFNRCTASSPDGIVNQINWQGESPLMVACKSGCPRCVGFLLEMGADLLQRGGQENWNPMHFAAAHGRLPVLHLLLGNAAIIQTVSGPRAAVHVLLRNRAWVYRYIDSPSAKGLTPLHLATLSGNPACIQALACTGASLVARSSASTLSDAGVLPAGSTPLHIAAQHGDVGIVGTLLQAQAHAARTRGQSQMMTGQLTGSRRDGRITVDPRAVANEHGQLPSCMALLGSARGLHGILNPSMPIDRACELATDLQRGGALRKALLGWLEKFNPGRPTDTATEPPAGMQCRELGVQQAQVEASNPLSQGV
ncbi:hypothetical protein WJX84_005931 [Apatococcus fuscideae]|uniref:Uncharacterized protein n=1 Tax=Apatococcus fuscideae TaxID=2026836 RepID=A0AAW1RPJ5_9CHLO